MGLSVGEMLQKDFFKDFVLAAGHKGLSKHVQGIAVLDAPDGFGWTRGREFIISSGYVFKQKPDLLDQYIQSGQFPKASCIGIKLGRYIDQFPDELIQACNDYDIPLVNIPMGISWMDIMNNLNVIVMNKNIEHFNIGKVQFNNLSDLSYHVRKINRILSAVETEMDFPAMLYNLTNDKAFYSSERFKEISQGMQPEEFWNPPFNFSKEILCENLKMARYRIFDTKYDSPYSWITVPIKVDNKVQAYFVVLEATGLIDYFDQFALRTGYLLLQELYEQILVTQSIGDIGFESFVNALVSGKLTNETEIRSHAEELSLDPDLEYYTLVVKETIGKVSMSKNRDLIRTSIRGVFSSTECRTAIINDDHCLMLLFNKEGLEEQHYITELRTRLKKLNQRLTTDLEGARLYYALSDVKDDVVMLERNYKRCLQTLSVGEILDPQQLFKTYSSLGALAWLSIRPDEIELMKRDLGQLQNHPDAEMLMETLKVYLECKMNFSQTSKQMFLHINTVRKRIDEVISLLPVDLEDPAIRLKLELLLKFVS
ncbi:PucR family transcriptional regulator [Acidaminobacter hydrogenoformans]|uniref:Purine catabolism regulatory protein n=1 Tax=Acidaminobacter hydrogenoformans DSM 2784 TaxID=1120920 RepID=A0A1G5RUZ1_9FIRM|nr:PucR family transcriptional regulator [Acidaminobacter hydrogenoformans]SCZ77922.1 purine catabolism regulatory protein [Acidaminobacter hydrogenoformans DSM 2784]